VVICALMMLVGVVIRFTFLDGKIFGNDEATTSIHVSGKTLVQYSAAMFDGQPRTAQEVRVFQEPDRAHGIGDVVRSLAIEDPQHPPLYYVLERQWEVAGGSSISARRVLSAVYGTLSVLCAVWFGLELFSLLAGFISGALVAASPFAIAYSQVAREYSLWLALTFASCALFLRAARRTSFLSWFLYALVSIAGLYTDALFLLVIVAQVLAVVFAARGRRSALLGFAASLILIAAAFVPWVLALTYGWTHGIVTNNVYLGAGLSLKPFVLKWIFNIGTLFYDADYLYPKSAVLIIPGILALVLAFIACGRRLREDPAIVLVFTLATVAIVGLVLPDLLHHEQRSTASRYLIPLWVACYAALAVGLARSLRSTRAWVRGTSVAFLVLTAATGFGSFAISATHDTWWIDGSTAPMGAIARAVAATKDPVIIYHSTWGPGRPGPELWDFSVVMLADVVAPSTRFVQYGRDEAASMPALSGSLLLLDPTDGAIDALRARGDRVEKIAGGQIAAVSPEIAALRKSVARERERHGAATLSPVPSLWSFEAH
jgi:uncharacterized membrane protein